MGGRGKHEIEPPLGKNEKIIALDKRPGQCIENVWVERRVVTV